MDSSSEPQPSATQRKKAELRSRIRAARKALSDERRAARDAAMDAWAALLAEQFCAERRGRAGTVSSYIPTRLEPGTDRMLSAFADRGARVIVPVVVGLGAPLAWRRWPEEGPLLPPETLGEAALVLVPALAVDRLGTRLGQGGGHYDRSLAHAAADARLVGVVDDGELVAALPREAHDRPLGWVLAPGGLRRIGRP